MPISALKITFVLKNLNSIYMKILYYLIFSFLFVNLSFAQEDENQTEKNYERTGDTPIYEAKLNVGLVFIGNANFTYENLLNDESSIGASVSFPFDDFISWDLNFSATAFYRFYFGEGYGKGVFAEGFGMFNNYEETLKKGAPGERFDKTENVSDFALGLGGGYKMVSKGGVSLEFHLGIGRNLFNYGLDGRSFNFVPRGGIHVGYQF
ncbi:hypothetical protein GCM10010832_25960 [Psychroflexus planctonicus]|uniref:DUF3575 domain-containing protein n=2 Tax=Psychroflexus planctonicus TaxID=1526575 RepID=A0ABQ1SN30_9FLAO|nr:hypothetical protein GCM10010832_25960 [Psychroflexus planctonicus]